MLHWLYYIVITAAALDAIVAGVSLWRSSGRRERIYYSLRIPTVLLIMIGFIMVEVSTAETAIVSRELMLAPLRLAFGAGGLTWIASSVFKLGWNVKLW